MTKIKTKQNFPKLTLGYKKLGIITVKRKFNASSAQIL